MILDYLLTFIIVALSGNPAALSLGKEAAYIGIFLVLLFLWLKRPTRIEKHAILFTATIGGLALVHLLSFGPMVLMASMGFLVIIVIGILAATVIDGFFRKYIRMMAILSCISLVFYVPILLGVDLPTFLSFLNISIETQSGVSAIRHIGIHNFHLEGEMRNCSMFWEPGAFAGYLVLALFLVVVLWKNTGFSRWEIAALIAGLLSTQSTMGYLAGLTVLTLFLVRIYLDQRNILALLTLPFVFIGAGVISYYLIDQLDFLGGKIKHQIYLTQTGSGAYEFNRFGNIVYDLDFIYKRPLTGWSGNPQTRLAVDADSAELIAGQGVALTGFWVRFGAIGLFSFFLGLYAASKSVSKHSIDGLFFVLTIFVILTGEQYTNFPLIYAFLIRALAKQQRKPITHRSPLTQVEQIHT